MGQNFNGSTDVLYKTATNPGINSITAMAWVRVTSYTAYHSAFGMGANTSGGYTSFVTRGDLGNVLAFWTGSGWSSGDITLTAATWYHLCMTRAGTSAGQLLGYRDGTQTISGTAASGPTNARLWLGNNADSDNWNGDLFAFKVWDAILTADEIRQEMRQNMPVRWANLNVWLPLIDNSPTVNYSSVGGNFTSAGTPTFTDNAPIPWRAARRKLFLPLSASGAQTLNADLVAAPAVPLAPTLTGGAVSMAASLVSAPAVPLAATLNSVISVTAALVAAAAIPQAPTISGGAVSMTAALVSAPAVPLAPALQSVVSVAAALVSATASVATAALNAGTISATAALVSATAVPLAPAFSGGSTLGASLVAAAGVPLAASLTGGAVSMPAGLVAGAGAVLSPTLSPGAITATTTLVAAPAATLTASLSSSGGVSLSADLVAATGSVFTAALQVDGAAGAVLGFYYRRRRTN